MEFVACSCDRVDSAEYLEAATPEINASLFNLLGADNDEIQKPIGV
jgi:hypothetical protein